MAEGTAGTCSTVYQTMARGIAHAGATVDLEYVLKKSSVHRLKFCGLKM
jgi:hypothetical protein